MKQLLIFLGIVAACVLGYMSVYNGVINASEQVDRALGDIDAQLQRRSDLIPNLVNAVSGYMGHEKEAIELVTNARAKLNGAQSIEQKSAANNELSRALGSFMLVVENYPDLKASTNFIQLQDELAGTENRIAFANRTYNEAVSVYNLKIKGIPGKWIAENLGYKEREYFKIDEAKKEAPKVEFKK